MVNSSLLGSLEICYREFVSTHWLVLNYSFYGSRPFSKRLVIITLEAQNYHKVGNEKVNRRFKTTHW